MKKKIMIESILKYSSEIIIKQPESDDDLHEILYKVEKECMYDSADMVGRELNTKYGIEIIEDCTDYLDCLTGEEIEISECWDIEEEDEDGEN